MAATGHLLHYLIHPRHAAGVAKEKVCDDTPLELGVELVAQWPLGRPPAAPDTAAPLAPNNPLLHPPHFKSYSDASVSEEERWLAQVEIVTHAGPHRRLWMGPQFVFKMYNTTLSGSSSSLLEAEEVEVEAGGVSGAARSPPVNMPGARPLMPVLIDSGSASSLEHSPSDSFRRKSYIMETGSKPVGDKALGDVQLREDLAEAMRETEQGSRCGDPGSGHRVASVARAVDPLGTVVAPVADDDSPEEEDPDQYTQANTDEALFRPVVRAHAALPPQSELSTSPLPAGTRIPVQNLARADPLTPDDDSVPLKSEVVIPAALTGDERMGTHAPQEKSAAVRSSVEKDTGITLQKRSDKRDEYTFAQRHSVKKEKDEHIFPPLYSAKKEHIPPKNYTVMKDEYISTQPQVVERDDRVSAHQHSEERDSIFSVQSPSIEKHENVLPQCSEKKQKQATPPLGSVEREDNLHIKAVQQCSGKNNEYSSDFNYSIMNAEYASPQPISVKKDISLQPRPTERGNRVSLRRNSLENEEVVPILQSSLETILPTKPDVENKAETEAEIQNISEPANTAAADKQIQLDKSLYKAKSRDRRSVTPREELLKCDNEVNDTIDSLPKSKDVPHTEIQACNNSKSSVKKPNKKCIKNVYEAKQVVEIKQDDNVEQEFVEYTVRLSSRKGESREIAGSMKDEKCVKDNENTPLKSDIIDDNSFNKTEDQIWAMLSEHSRVQAEGTVNETRKIEEMKPKSKKNKKNRKTEQENDEIMKSLPAANSKILNVGKEDDKHELCATSSYKRDETKTSTSIDKKIEPLANLIKSTSSPSESSINIELMKDATDSTDNYLTHSEVCEISTTSIDKKSKAISSSKLVMKEPESFPKVEQIAKDPLGGFDLPIDFESYLINKDNNKKSSVDSKNITSNKKEDSLQELFSDSLFSLQPSKSKKSNRKERVKNDDFVSIDKLENKESGTSESKKYVTTIIDIDSESKFASDNKLKSEDSEIVIVHSAMEDFPTIASSHNPRSNKKRWGQPLSAERCVAPPIKSYSSIVSKPSSDVKYDSPGLDPVENILEPPKPCRMSLHEKLFELCKRTDIAVAECDAPDLTFVDEEPSSEFDLPPLEPLAFSMDEFKLDAMRDSLFEDEVVGSVRGARIDNILFNIKGTSEGRREADTRPERNVAESGSEGESKSATKMQREQAEKCSDDDNTSPVSSQTDSDDKEDKRNAATDSSLPAQKSNSKKKARQKRRK